MCVGPKRPLKLAIYNQVDYHLHVVAGAMRVLQPLTSAPITVFLTSKVVKHNWYGFMDFLGGEEGFVWRELHQYDDSEAFDFVWFISPEFDLDSISQVAQQMKPALQLFYVHNGHMPEQDFEQLRALSADLPLVGMAPHVCSYIGNRLQQQQAQQPQQGEEQQQQQPRQNQADWLLPIWPFEPANKEGHESSVLKGFSITGSLDKSLRNYSRMWEQIRAFKESHGAGALENFKLNILGDVLGDFAVPEDLQQYVKLYKTPPDGVFYDAIFHSYGIVPALANPAYYTCKLTSAVITTLMTGTPVLADQAFLEAYSMLSPETVFEQREGEDELQCMFRVAQLPQDVICSTRAALQALRQDMNERCVMLLLGWLRQRGLQPDDDCAAVKAGL